MAPHSLYTLFFYRVALFYVHTAKSLLFTITKILWCCYLFSILFACRHDPFVPDHCPMCYPLIHVFHCPFSCPISLSDIYQARQYLQPRCLPGLRALLYISGRWDLVRSIGGHYISKVGMGTRSVRMAGTEGPKW